jgi:hypothetical protein
LSESKAKILQEVSHSAPPILSVIALDANSTLYVSNSVEKNSLSHGTPNRPELGQATESDTAPDPHRGPHRHFQKFLAGYILFAFHASSQGDSCAIF